MKKLLSALGIIAAVLLLLIVAVLFSIGPIAGWFINHKAGDFIEASVSVDGVSANLPAGRVGLRGFQIGQPTGFEGDALARVGSFSLDVGIGSVVGGGPIAIRGVRIEDVELLVVKNAEGAMNVERVAPAGEADGAAGAPGGGAPGEEAAPPAGSAQAAGEAGPPRAVRIEQFELVNASITYRDYSISEERPIDIRIRDLTLTLTNVLFDPLSPPGDRLPGRARLAAVLERPGLATGRIGAEARLGVLGTNIPAVAAAVRINGFGLKTVGAAVPPGVASTLGGDVLDIALDLLLSPTVLNLEGAVRTAGSRFPFSVSGTPEKPVIGAGALLFGTLGRGFGAAGNAAAGAGRVGTEIAEGAGKSALAVGKGVGKLSAGIGKGLLRTVKGAATLDFEEAGKGLSDTTVGSLKEAGSTVSEAGSEALSGVKSAGSAAVGQDKAASWSEGTESRFQESMAEALLFVEQAPYPEAPAPGQTAR